MSTNKTVVNKEILIEDLISLVPGSISYLMEKGICCLRCGEPVWGSLESAAQEKGYDEEKLVMFVEDLNALSVQNK